MQEEPTGGTPRFAAGTPSLLRQINERTVLESIRRTGPVSRAQIARESGLSKPTVSLALTALARARLVREAGRTSGGKGPTAVLYELNPSAGWVVGVDVGREHVRAAVADLTGEIVARRDERARTKSSGTLIAQIGAIARDAAQAAGLRWRQVTAVAVGSPGVIGRGDDHPVLAHNLPGWERQGLLEAVRSELGTEVTFENDVNLAALGERWRGLGRGVDDFVYLHVGTGVGMGIVLRGQLYRGSSGAAGEVGYLPLANPDPQDPANRRRGALEAAIGAKAVVAAARAAGMERVGSALAVFEAARDGDPGAGSVVEAVGARVGLAIAAIVPVLDPSLVILGGGIGRSADLLLPSIWHELEAVSPFRPRIEASSLGEEAELVGAVAFALEAARERLFARGDARGGIAV
jgi:predicted NBD/HSP70 family sugar kinase